VPLSNGFQPESSVDTALWRYQELDSLGRVINETYVNLGQVKYMKTVRVNAPVVGGQTNQVSLWFEAKTQDQNPDIVLTGPAATQFLADMDAVFTP
jgi:hypothetical protein